MQTKDSIRHGLRFVSSLGETSGAEIDKFNPFHDEKGQFASRGGALKGEAKAGEGKLREKAKEYNEKAKAENKVGPRGAFMGYVPKAQWTGKEPEEWKKLNREVGSLEGQANAYEKRADDPVKAPTEDDKKILLAHAEACRKAALQLANQRDKIEVEKSLLNKAIPSALRFILDQTDAPHGYSDSEEAVLPSKIAMDLKRKAIKNALSIGAITEEEANGLLDGLKEE